MTSAVPIDVPVLSWSRAAGNRHKTWLLGVVTVLTLAPFVWGVSYLLASWIVVPIAPHAISGREQALARQRAAIDANGGPTRAGLSELMVLLALLQSAGLGLLFWSIAASPTSKLLVEAGAAPAGASQKEARQLLESLAAAAGLPAPKLYLIESNVPNAFAAGDSPRQSVLAVTRGLLQLLDREELEGVFAHELSHIGNEDVRLNSVVASVALFLRIPYLLFRRELQAGKRTDMKRRRNPWRLMLSPMGIYILLVAPVLAAVIRAMVARGRDYLADADAVHLAGSPRGLLRALAKIGGSGSTLAGANAAFAHYYFASPAAAKDFSGSLVASHPPVAERIHRLSKLRGAPPVEVLKEAIETGRRYLREHPALEITSVHGIQDELASFNRGNPMGRVYRMMAIAPAPVYESPSKSAPVLTRVKPGALIVVFDDPGKMRQVNTAQQTFGYMERSTKLVPMQGLIPAEVYDPVSRAAAEAQLSPIGIAPATGRNPARAQSHRQSLTFVQILAATAVFVVVFAGMFLALSKFGN